MNKNSTWVRAVCLGFALLGLSSGAAQAQVVTEFSARITPGSGLSSITAGPVADGNLWFTEGAGRIGRITPLGVVTEFPLTAGSVPRGITAGPDGNLWFTEGGIGGDRIGQITPAGVVTEFSAGITNGAIPEGITAGPDDNLWFTESGVGQIGRITPLGVVTEFGGGIIQSPPFEIAAGPDGNLWFTEPGVGQIGRITPLGVVKEFSTGISAGAGLGGITAGPVADGNVWFTEFNGNRIGRITPLGVVKEFSAGITAGSGPNGITAGPDGNLWFTETNGNGQIGRITPLGVVKEFSCGITPNSGPTGITAGPDGNLWFTEGSDRIGRITTGPAVAPPTIAKSFGAASIPLNGSTSLSFRINNPNASTTLTGIGFDDALPSGLVVSTPNGLIGSCDGGSIAASAGSGFVQLFDATLAANASCTFSVNVTGTTAGIKNNTTGAVTSVEGCNGNTASASVTVGVGIGASFFTVTPCRLLDTRRSAGPYGGPALSAGNARAFVLAGGSAPCGIPATATAVSVNVVAILPDGPGFLTIYPGSTTQPATSTMNYNAGKIRANNAIVSLGAAGDINAFCGQGAGTTDLIIDVSGYFQ